MSFSLMQMFGSAAPIHNKGDKQLIGSSQSIVIEFDGIVIEIVMSERVLNMSG